MKMSLVDLGKRLLEAARKGQDDEVRTLMANGAPFTTDWVSSLDYSQCVLLPIFFLSFLFIFLRFLFLALAGVAQWIECWPANQRSLVQFPVRAHAWVVGQVPRRGHMRGNHTLMFLSLSFFLLSPLSKNK